MSLSKVHLMLVGNPGTGKSTLLNGLLGEPIFNSGFSTTGRGITERLQKHEKNGVVYMDTPGLADPELRQQAAAAITEGLQQGGRYKIFFVFTTEAGRVRPQDKTSMELILKAAPIGHNYGVIINKVSARAGQAVMDNAGTRDQILGSLFMNCDPTIFVYFNSSDEALEDLDNVVKRPPQDLVNFIEAMPSIEIHREHVRGVDASHFDQIQERFDQQLEALKRDNEMLRQRLAAMAPALQNQVQEAQQQNPEVLNMAPMINDVVNSVAGIVGLVSKCSVM